MAELAERRRSRAARRPGSSGARSATSCSGRAVRRPRHRLPGARAAPRVRFARRGSGGAVFPLSERHGGWRVALDGGRTVDFTPLQGGRSRPTSPPATSRSTRSPCRSRAGSSSTRSAAAAISQRRRLARGLDGASSTTTRCACCAPCASRTSSASGSTPATERLVRENAAALSGGRRASASSRSCCRLSAGGFRARWRARAARAARRRRRPAARRASTRPTYRLAVAFGADLTTAAGLERAPPLRRTVLLRAEPPADGSPRAIHRFRRATEPWALDALAFLGAGDLAPMLCRGARASEPAEPLLRGDELGVAPGPEVGRLLDSIAEERAAGTISTREEALELVQTIAGAEDRGAASPSSRSAAAAELTEHVRALRSAGGRRARARRRARGTGALAFALAPTSPRSSPSTGARAARAEARQRAASFPNVTFVEGDATSLDLERGSFDLAGCARTLHHVHRPELVVAELARVTRIGGRVLVIDQIAPGRPAGRGRARPLRARPRPLAHAAARRRRRAARCSRRTGSSSRGREFVEERRDLDRYLDLAGCEGEARERAGCAGTARLHGARRLVSAPSRQTDGSA